MPVEDKLEQKKPTSKPALMYVSRTIDRAVWDVFLEWWADPSKREGWISLESDRGRGNTFLLEHFGRQVENHPNLGPQTRVILADADANQVNEDLPQELPPVASTV